jgi:chorismate mutase / prephenate dehydrogenase
LNNENLNNLRTIIEDIDENLVSLIAKRVETAEKIGKIKLNLGLPIRNYQVEKNVYHKMQKVAEKFDVDPHLIVSISSMLIENSVKAQEQLFAMEKVTKSSETILRNVLIVGLGNMGQWFANFFASEGDSVVAVDPFAKSLKYPIYSSIEDLNLNQFDYIFLCTPLDLIPSILSSIINQRPRGIVIEISSVKSHLLETFEKARSNEVKLLSIHPLFGPNSMTLYGKTMIFCETGNDLHMNQVQTIFERTAVEVIRCKVEEHDSLMGYTLNLAHLINLINGAVLQKANSKFKEMKKFASQTFLKQLNTTKEVFDENPSLYHAIQHYNQYTPILTNEIKEAVYYLESLITTPLSEEFMNFMTSVRDTL